MGENNSKEMKERQFTLSICGGEVFWMKNRRRREKNGEEEEKYIGLMG